MHPRIPAPHQAGMRKHVQSTFPLDDTISPNLKTFDGTAMCHEVDDPSTLFTHSLDDKCHSLVDTR